MVKMRLDDGLADVSIAEYKVSIRHGQASQTGHRRAAEVAKLRISLREGKVIALPRAANAGAGEGDGPLDVLRMLDDG
jgi:hypothetical protein